MIDVSTFRLAIERSVQLLEWQQDYQSALMLLEKASQDDPEFGEEHVLDRAQLLVRAGALSEGIDLLKSVVDSDSGNAWGWLALGATYVDLARYEEAEPCLDRAVELALDEAQRAESHWLRFELSRRRRDAEKAVAAWESACNSDAGFEARRPAVCRALIEMRHFDLAGACLEHEPNEARRAFYRGLIEYAGGGAGYYRFGEMVWQQIAERAVGGTEQCPDEYAEACLYLGRPRDALRIVEPLVQADDASVHRLVLMGLAQALLGDLGRATTALSAAVRLADGQWPRQTRAGTGSQRILSQQARIMYGDIVKGKDLRAELDRYFIPLPH